MLEVVVDADSLQRTAAGSIIGTIYLQGPAGSFPSEYWSDFPVVLLNWWITGLGLVASGDRKSYSGDFMDGPYSFRIEADTGDEGRIAWGNRGTESPVGIVSIAALLKSTEAAGRLVLKSCRANNWASRDLDSLGQSLAAWPNNSFEPKPLRGSA